MKTVAFLKYHRGRMLHKVAEQLVFSSYLQVNQDQPFIVFLDQLFNKDLALFNTYNRHLTAPHSVVNPNSTLLQCAEATT